MIERKELGVGVGGRGGGVVVVVVSTPRLSSMPGIATVMISMRYVTWAWQW